MQVINITISIIRSKIIAVLLGPAGMGIATLLNSTIRLIEGFSGLGLGTSAIKNVAEANASGDSTRVQSVVGVLRKLVWITGLAGSLITFFTAPWLSRLTFGSESYIIAFRWISITLLFNQISIGQGVVLRGMRQLRLMAKASMLGSLLGLIISVPVYYYFRIDGIVPAIIISSVISLMMTWVFSRKVNVDRKVVSIPEAFKEGEGMIRMGLMLSLSSLITLGASYIVRIYINSEGGLEKVGLYNAGFALINTYVGMVFTAMATDYYPRLSGLAADNKATGRLVNEQAEISILILAPILTVFLVFINWIVVILYSEKFIAINSMIHWAAVGVFFKATSFSLGYVLLAKSASKVFLWSEVSANIYLLGLNLLGYKLGGLEGLGISFMAGYLFYLIQIFAIIRIKYEFHFDKVFLKIFGIQLTNVILCFIASRYFSGFWLYFAGIALILLTSYYSIRELRVRLSINIDSETFRNYFRRNKT